MLITDGWNPAVTPGRLAAALGALAPGEAAVQLRAPALFGRTLFEAATTLGSITRDRRAPLLVNDRLDLALATGAAGVHLPGRGLSAEAARRLAPRPFVVGCSTHSLAEALRAARGGADYVTFGPVFPTASKAGMGEPAGLAALAEVVAALAPLPVFALGGIDAARAPACAQAGARVACIGAVLGRTDAAAGAGELARALGLAGSSGP